MATNVNILALCALLLLVSGCGSSDDAAPPAPVNTIPTAQQFDLSVAVVGNGSVTRNPAGGQCGSATTDCGSYSANTNVTLMAVPASGSHFIDWTDDCNGSTASSTVTVDADKSCTATFQTNQTTPVCGNNLLEPPEQCDDGNLHSGDGCSNACLVESTTTSIFDPAHPFHQYVVTTGTIPQSDPDGGSFRVKCEFSHLNYDDSIVYPGEQDRSHLHMYFGNTLADYSTTLDRLTTVGTSTCHGGPINRSGYWVPSVMAPVYDSAGQGQYLYDADGFISAEVVTPVGGISATDVYYKAAVSDLSSINPMPPGLRMITGNAMSTGPQPKDVIQWSCESDVIRSADDFSDFIPACQIGDNVRVTIFFPSCWDGVNLDTPDHSSHMAQPGTYNWPQSAEQICPATHPVPVPEVSYNIAYAVTANNAGPDGTSSGWMLSSDMYDVTNNPGGYSGHGDWFMAWNNEIMQTLTQNCLHLGLHCANGELGQGWALTGHQSTGTQHIPPTIARGMGPSMLP